MGVSVRYESDRPLVAADAAAVRAAADQFNAGRWWLYSEGVILPRASNDDSLTGWSKVLVTPSADEVAAASRSGLVISGVTDVVAFLAQTSAAHGFGWQLSIDGQPLGQVRDGAADTDLASKIETLAQLAIDPEAFLTDLE